MPSPFLVRMSAFLKPRQSFALLVVLWCLTLAGIQSIPLETHESFVLATAQEMKTGGDWILPHYNNEMRLQKPPLSYWATMLVSAVDPVTGGIQIYHGRLVSLLAVLMMVLLTARTGGKLYGKEAGILAALFLMCTNGMLSFSHNAKPDVLYAAFCGLQLFAWIDAWQAETPARQKRAALLGWAAAALATLTKGPQVPAVFLLGVVLFLVTGPDRRRAFKILRPLSGTVLFCLLVAPWWLILQQRLGTLGLDLADSQLSGSLLRQLSGCRKLLQFYYLWLPFEQMFPVSLLLVLILPPLIKKRTAMQPSTRLLICVSLAMLFIFTFGSQYRKHYILPLLPVFSMIIAGGVRHIPFRGFRGKGVLALSVAGAAGSVACVGFMVWNGAIGMLGLYSGLVFLLVLLLKRELAGTFSAQPVFTRQLLVVATALIPLGAASTAYWPTLQAQMAEQEFKKHVGEQLSGNARLVCWKTSVNILPYYARQPVCAFTNRDELMSYVAANQTAHAVFAVIPFKELASFSQSFKTRILQTAVNKRKPKDGLSFVEILGVQERDR